MNLDNINTRLIDILEELQIKIPELELQEQRYYDLYNRYVLTSSLKTAADRESETKVRLADEGITEPYRALRTAVRILLTEKEILIEVSKNLRINRGGKNDLPF